MPIRPVHVVCCLLIFSPLLWLWHIAMSSPPTTIKFWNGNKSVAQQNYEREVLMAVLTVTKKGYGDFPLEENNTNFPSAIALDEGSIFSRTDFDIYSASASSSGLESDKGILVAHPLMQGLQSYRLLVVRESEKDKLGALSTEELRRQRIGVIQGTTEADIWRRNGYALVEADNVSALYENQLARQSDYSTVAVTEVDSLISEVSLPAGLVLDPSSLIYSPQLQVFYINPKNLDLARRINQGMHLVAQSGQLEAIFQRHYGELIIRLNLRKRHLIKLNNPDLPPELIGYQSVFGSK